MRYVLALLTAILFIGCNDVVSDKRGVYMLYSPTKEQLAQSEPIESMFEYIVNDLSAGEVLVIESLDQSLTLQLSNDLAKAHEQKIAFKQSIKAFIDTPHPEMAALTSEALFTRAQKHLDKPAIAYKSIILWSQLPQLDPQSEWLKKGYTLSVVDLAHKKTAQAQATNFIVASNTHDLDRVLSFH